MPKGKGRICEANVRGLLDQEHALAAVVLPLLEAWCAIRNRAAELDRLLLRKVRDDANCRLMTARHRRRRRCLLVAAIESPANFKHARDVGAWVGLTPRRFQSGEMDYDGHISRRGDERLRALLYEAATVILTRVRSASALRSWALALKKRLGFKRAAVALARKLAVVLHVMWKTGKNFDPNHRLAA